MSPPNAFAISALDNSYRNVGREHPVSQHTVLPSAASIAFFNSFPVIFLKSLAAQFNNRLLISFPPVHEQAPLLLSTTLHPSVRNLHFHDRHSSAHLLQSSGPSSTS